MRKKSILKTVFGTGAIAFVILAVVLWGKSGGDVLSDNAAKGNSLPLDTSGMKHVVYTETADADDGSFIKVASSEHLDLYYRESDGSIAVKDRRNDYDWVSSADKSKLDNFDQINEMWKYKISSLLNIKYFDSMKNQGVPVETNALKDNAMMACKPTGNGINIRYVFENIQLEIQVNITLNDDKMTIEVPFGGIKENSAYKLAGIEIMPLFGAAGPGDSGYVFYPDGSGAISKYDTQRTSVRVSQYRWPIYGNDVIDIDQEARNADKGIRTAMLPVFGMKNGQNAFVAVISKGAADSAIDYSPSGLGVKLNRIYTEVVYRRLIDESILGSSSADDQKSEKIQQFQTEIQEKDVAVDYFFLYGEDADYSGMANRCRTYFEESGLIGKPATKEKGMPLAVDLFMGINENRAILDKYVSLTDFRQAQEILEKISGIYKGKLIVSLSGWGENGHDRYPTLPSADGRIGGNTGLKELSEYIGGKAWDMYLNVDLMDYDKRSGGYSLTRDVIYYGNTLQVTDQTQTMYLLNVNNFFDKFMGRYRQFAFDNGAGLAFDKYGSSLLVDFNDKHTRDQTAGRIAGGMAGLRENGVKIAGEGNLYMLGTASYLQNIPQSDSGYDITDETVPFYQMVVHGLIPYTSEPGNLASDYQWQKLKWVEYGCAPYYMLTYDSAGKLKYTAYNTLFSSSYQNWTDAIGKTMEEYSELADLSQLRMVGHDKLNEGLYRITYENGAKVYVNYNSKPESIESVTVEAMNFKISK